jgi:hypothetical protein
VIRPDPLRPSPFHGGVEEQSSDGTGSIVVAGAKKGDGMAITIDPTVDNHLPITELMMPIDVP